MKIDGSSPTRTKSAHERAQSAISGLLSLLTLLLLVCAPALIKIAYSAAW